MDAAILILVVIASLLTVASGIWVATALVSAISTHQSKTGEQPPENKETGSVMR
ncbi:MAG TPA: hypothetical protein VMW16_08040 [Sedimentisphaerales bacterium]|nr:hypothetical protein [Sedimentisphaerales bacterium]